MTLILPKPPAVPGLVLGTTPTTPTWGDVGWRSPGVTNLLTRNIASACEDGVPGAGDRLTFGLAVNATVAASTATALVGSACLAHTSAAGGASTVEVRYPPVVPGRVYTVVASTKAATTGRSMLIQLRWLDAAYATISTISGSTSTSTTSAWSLLSASGLAPANAAYCVIRLVINDVAAAVGEVHYWDGIGLWEGHGGTWAMPGDPIQGIGVRWDESVGRRAFMWDTVNGREQMVYGDTGWRVNPGWFGADWNEATFYVRRINWTIYTWGYLKRVTASGTITGTMLTALPTGWRGPTGDSSGYPAYARLLGGVHYLGMLSLSSAGAQQFQFNTAGVTLPSTWAANDRLPLIPSWEASDSWPTSLPGTAYGSIPYA